MTDCRTRIPFRFGVVTMTEAPAITARVELETEDGKSVNGFSSDLLVPKWFDKNPATTIREDTEALLDAVRDAGAALVDAPAASVFAHWRQTYAQCVQPSPPDQRLVRGFGVALLERALMDAACRAAGLGFSEALRADLFQFQPESLAPELADWRPADALPEPAERIALRHTVGLADPLRRAEVAPNELVDDGLPHTLEDDVERYGLRTFKIKICGDQEKDVQRLWSIAELLDERTGGDWRFSLDGNEQFASMEQLLETLRVLARTGAGANMLARMMYVEQPLPRAISFAPEATIGIEALSELAPVIIDEADTELAAFPRALEVGYAGVSVKACKGVFRALINAGRCAHAGDRAFLSGEDLTNLGVLALQEDLALAAALGLDHVERNGHHYFRGLAHLPAEEQKQALEQHADLYEPTDFGASLRVRDGQLDIGSLRCVGFGYKVDIRDEERTPLEAWLESRDV